MKTRDPDAGNQDGGASTFLVGSEYYLLRYLKWLEHIGFDVQTIPFKRTDKPFKFGGDVEGRAKWMAQLPVNLGGKLVGFNVTSSLVQLLCCWVDQSWRWWMQ